MRGLSKATAALGAAALMVAGGGAVALASGGGGKITVCVSHSNHTLYKASKCRKHDKKLSWNKQGLPGKQGPPGQPGQQGPKGDTGAPGQTGNGYQFTTMTGTHGPTLSQGGTYFVDVEASITSGGPLTGFCSVDADNSFPSLLSNFAGAFNNPSASAQPGTWSFSGMLVVPSNQTPATTHIVCDDSAGNPVAITNVNWWVSPIGT